jgi:hypothetical protein
MDMHEVVEKLTGKIEPIGESNTDEERFENLKILCNLVENLLIDIDQVRRFSICSEFSRKRAGEYVTKWLKNLRENVL